MINQYFKKNNDYENQIKKLGARMMSLDERMEAEEIDDSEF